MTQQEKTLSVEEIDQAVTLLQEQVQASKKMLKESEELMKAVRSSVDAQYQEYFKISVDDIEKFAEGLPQSLKDVLASDPISLLDERLDRPQKTEEDEAIAQAVREVLSEQTFADSIFNGKKKRGAKKVTTNGSTHRRRGVMI